MCFSMFFAFYLAIVFLEMFDPRLKECQVIW